MLLNNINIWSLYNDHTMHPKYNRIIARKTVRKYAKLGRVLMTMAQTHRECSISYCLVIGYTYSTLFTYDDAFISHCSIGNTCCKSWPMSMS